MKKILCYVALLLLITIIFLPPALRMFYRPENNEPKVIDTYELMNCKKGNFTIDTSYKNSNPLNIRFSYLEEELDLDVDNEHYELELSLARLLNNEPKINFVEKNIDDNKLLVYTLLYSEVTDTNKYSDYNLAIADQKNLYTSYGYTCNVING